MTESKIQIEQVKVGELLDFANRPEVMRGKTVPISRLRAAAHAANPLADPDDVVLLVAMRDNVCVGYVGFMPGQLRIDGKIHRIFWYSTWYAPEDSEGLAAGGVLLHASLRLNLDLAATGLDPKTFEYYRRLRFKTIGALSFFELDFDRLDLLGCPWRFLQVMLRRRGRRFALLDSVFQACRRLTKWAAYRMLSPALERLTREFDLQEVPELPVDAVSDETEAAVEFCRSTEVVCWALRHPWVTDRQECSTPQYAFSDIRELVRFVILEVRLRSSNEMAGHVVVSICRDKGITTVKVLDHFLCCEGRYDVLLSAAMKYASLYRADRIHVPAECGPILARPPLLRWAFRRRIREYFCYPRKQNSVLGPVLDRITPNYCDGDTPFS